MPENIIVGIFKFYIRLAMLLFIFVIRTLISPVPLLMDHFHVTKTQLGWILTAASIVYDVGKFFNGFISDKSNARIFMACGLGLG